jgi:hypothetical protein
LALFEPATFGSNGKHTNHYTTEVTINVYFVKKFTSERKWQVENDNALVSSRLVFPHLTQTLLQFKPHGVATHTTRCLLGRVIHMGFV